MVIYVSFNKNNLFLEINRNIFLKKECDPQFEEYRDTNEDGKSKNISDKKAN